MLKTKLFQDYSTEWLKDGNCRVEDTQLFFRDYDTDKFPDLERVRKICGTCPARRDCLDYAVSGREDDGFWGGMTEAERTQLRMQWGRSFPRMIKMIDANLEGIISGLQS